MADKPLEIVAILRDLVTRPAGDMNRALASTDKELKKVDVEARGASGGLTALARTASSSAGAFSGAARSIGTLVSSLTSIKSILLGGAIIYAFQQFTQAFGEVIDQLDELDSQAKRTGLGVRDLNRLQIAAKLANVEATQLSFGLGLLNRAAARISSDKSIQQAFKDLGISVEDVRNAKSVVDLLPRISEGIQGLSTAQTEQVLATLFGRAGPQLAAFFEGGTEKFKQSLAEVEAAGVVFTRVQVEQGAEIDKQLKLLSASWQKVKADLLAAIGPSAVSLIKGFRETLTQVPDKVRGFSELVAKSFDDSPDIRRAARTALGEIGGAAFDLLLDSAIDLGSLIAQGFLATLRVGIEALAPVFARLFDTSVSPLIRQLPGLSDFSLTSAGRVQAADEQIKSLAGRNPFEELASARRELARIQQEKPKQDPNIIGDFSLIQGQGLAIRQRAAADRVAALEREIANLDPSIREIKRIRDAAESQISRENEQVDENLRNAVAQGAREIKQGVDDLTTGFRTRFNRLFGLIPSVSQEPGRESELALAEQEDQARRSNNAANAEAKRVQSELDAARAKLEDQLLTLGAKAQSARLEIDRQLASTFGSDGKGEELRIQQLERRQRLERELGITFDFVADALDRLEQSETNRLEASKLAEELSRRATKIEQDRSRVLQDIQAQQQSGVLAPDEARRQQNAINLRFKQDAAEFGSAVDDFARRFPEYEDITRRIVEQSQRLRSDAFRIRPDAEGFSGGLSDGFDNVIRRYGDLADAGRQAGETIGTALSDGVASSITSVINGTSTMAQAFRSMAVNVLNSLTQIILRLLIVRALSSIFGAASTPQPGDAGFVGPLPEGFADGGLIGPGKSLRDDTLINAMRGEFVQPTSSVDLYGIGFMESVRRRSFPPSVARAFSPVGGSTSENIGSFMSGGAVGNSGNSPSQVLVIDERQADQFFGGSGGAGLRWLERNRTAVVGILNGGPR